MEKNRENVLESERLTPAERFDMVRNFWEQKILEGGVRDISCFQNIFYGPDSEFLRCSFDDNSAYSIAKRLLGLEDTVHDRQLPTSASTASTPAAGGASTAKS